MAMFGNAGSNANDPRRKLALKMAAKRFKSAQLPPGLQKKQAGQVSARQFAPGHIPMGAEHDALSKNGVPPVRPGPRIGPAKGKRLFRGKRYAKQPRDQFVSE